MAQPAPASSSLIPSTVRSYQLDKLSSTNYLTWATRVTLLLKRAALWDIVSDTTPKPAANDADCLAKDLQAQSELMLHLGDRQVQMFRRCQSSPEIWAFLRSTYHHEDLITRVTALKKLLLAVLTEHQDISKFLDDWRTLLDNALLSCFLLDDSFQAMLLLAALPTSWRTFITTQASVVGLTVETLIARILQEDAMRGNSTPTTIPSSQYVQRQSNFRRWPFRRFNNTRNPVNNPTPAKICIHCGRHGHLVHECRTKRREQQRTDRRPRSQLQHIEVPALSQYGMESLQLFTSMLNSTWDLATSTDTSAEWLLDTGATHHMTPTSSWLRDYKTFARHVQVYLGDNHCLHAIGLGNLHVTLPSGAAIIIRDIYHIPDLRRNILSVTAATSSGIQQQYTTPYTPQQNGVSERKNRTLVSAARAMLLTAGLSKPYWEEAVATAGYLQNRIPHAIDPQFTPYYHWFGKIPTLEHLRVFGCSAYPVQVVSLRHKLDATATKMVFVGYGDRLGVKAYRFYDPHHKKFHFARSVYFDESSLISPQQGITSPPQLTHPANPFNSTDPSSSTSVPRIEWEEEDVLRYIPRPNQPQVPPIQEIPSSPVPIGTPLPPNAPPWSLGRKTKTHLFPNIPHPLPVEPTAASSNPPHIQPSNSTPTSSSTPTNPYVPENPIHQPSLLGPSPTSRPSKSSKVRSLKEIYQNSHHSLLMDPSPSSTPIINDCLHEASFLDVAAADALYRQVLQAFSDDDFDRLLLIVETIDEISLDEALSGPEASSWRQAMDSEYQSLMANGTWQLVPAPPNRKLVTCKWLLRKKFHADGSVSRYKARLVARGFTQIPGMDYSETFSPVLRITSFRVLIAIAALFGFLLHQMDVRTAFLNGDLQEEIYMSQPDGGYTSLQHPDYVSRLLKALYGLKQSPRQWYLRFHQCMISLGYTRFQSDANVYSRHSTNVLLFLAIYVDDILILSNSQYAIDKAKGELQASFSMIDMGTLHYCLGIQVLQDPSKGLIRISQQTYIQSLLTKFNMSSCKGVETPLPTSLKLKQPDSTLTVSTETQSFPFANILGGIRYLVTCTRPDICFATNLLSRYMKAPSLQHIQHLKRLMRYLQHTKDYGICFYATHPLPTPFLFGYSDADWGGDQETLQSTSGFVYLLARGSISWQSKKQDRVTLSSTEAEYVAMTLALKEGIWLKHLLMETTLFANQPLRLLCDNMSAIMLARNLKHSEKTKHIAMKLQFIRELIQEGTIELTHVRSDQQLADFLTKSIPKAKHLESCQQLGICNLNYQLRGVCADIAL
ncbi:hypothetical protein L7F22_054759 [Adiantum nelumboides]|nr:hypothetical protein [Adiantum nelumboides]